MAVRKLAPEELQPKSFAFSPENEAFADQQIAKYPPGRQASAVIALLWRAQEQAGGWLPRKAIEAVAAKLDMAPIRVMEVATFYTMFNLEPVGKYFIQFCGTTPCALRGAGEIKKVLQARVGDSGHVSADGNFSWLEVECLGACCNAPMVQINDDYYEDLTPQNFEKLLDDLAAGRPVKTGSQIGRRTSEPYEAVNTLQDPSLYDGSVVGAWRKRFEETAQEGPTEAPGLEQRAAENPRAGKPDSGRAIGRVIETPANRVAEGKPPIDEKDRADAASKDRATAVEPRKDEADKPAPQSSKSYVAMPSKPEEGAPVAESPTTPIAGTPPSHAETRRDGSESKPDVVVDKDNKTS
ncbi:NADH-quinone oxidoreductase subunit NuoE [Microvirga lenta]|uniref:NADH-quinone oxidoreductase subunit NuoE n=1 Tax=Microvirga lenta TaxID=2881337 RepID=UPI001CFF9BC8|nr:NADH-quinone oxidoreductase subunit NuoE [Microvirga lenta]MCB5175979.1 NADH-quinone oxidoreductase subunit NuoE [Microvirga lenta]